MSTQPSVDYSAVRLWFDVGQFVITGGIGIWVWLGNRFNAKSKEVAQVKESVSAIHERVTRLETEADHALSHEDLGAVYDRMNAMTDQISNLSGKMANLSGKMDGVKGSVDMIHEYLLNDKGTNGNGGQ